MTKNYDTLVTRERASELLDRNRRTVGKALAMVEPDDDGPPPRWRLSHVQAALDDRAARVREIHSATAASSDDALNALCWEIEHHAKRCQALLDTLYREPDRGKRLQLLERKGDSVGLLIKALDRSVATRPELERPLAKAFCDQVAGRLLSEICWLVGITAADLTAFAATAPTAA
jgi:hypothetical protein